MAKSFNKSSSSRINGSVRIIGGDWRGRKLPVIDAVGLRPSSDRVRETLFNWLMPYISGSRCLDLFAGSGVLGFEALSRGAAFVDFVESQRDVNTTLKNNIRLLEAKAVVHSMQAQRFMNETYSGDAYDIVFIDPPFTKDLIEPCCHWLETAKCLSSGAYVYVESAVRESFNVPNNWRLHREKSTKQVASRLFVVE